MKNFSLEKCFSPIIDKDYQKIMLIEILAIVYTDNIMNEAEKKIIDTWNINSS